MTAICISKHASDRMAERIEGWKDKDPKDLFLIARQAVWCAMQRGLVFGNPKKEGQLLYYAVLNGQEVFLAGDSRRILTVLNIRERRPKRAWRSLVNHARTETRRHELCQSCLTTAPLMRPPPTCASSRKREGTRTPSCAAAS